MKEKWISLVWTPVILIFLISGCGTPIPRTYSISGRITIQGTTAGLAGVTLHIDGPLDHITAVSGVDGTWRRDGLIAPVTITPSMTEYTFVPSQLEASASNENLNFVAVPSHTGYAVSGQVSDLGGQGIEGVTLTSSAGPGVVMTTADGNWSMSGLTGTVTITPAKPGWEFSPFYRIVDAAAEGINFTGTYEISGRITQVGGSGLGGATVTITGDFGIVTAVTDSAGNWRRSGLYGTVTLTAEKTGWVLTPSSLTTSGPAGDMNFSGTALGRIAFISTRAAVNAEEVYVMAGDGSAQTRLTFGDNSFSAPSWSPDGTKIAVSKDDGQIYVIDAATGNATKITNAYSNDFPAWSPDGTKIAFSSFRNSNWDIYVMDADGGNQVQVTTTSSSGYYEFHPAWSPDGGKLAYVLRTNIFIVDLGTMTETQLTFTSTDLEDSPAWSPDGTRIVYTYTPSGGLADVYVMNTDGTGKTRLTNDSNDDMLPCWSPDGSRIAWSSARTGDWEIFVMTSTGGEATNLTNCPSAGDIYPTWIVP